MKGYIRKERIVVMRLYNVYYLCKISIEGIKKIQYTDNNYANRNHDYTIEGWTEAKQSYEIIGEISFLKNDVKQIMDYVPAYVHSDLKPRVSDKVVDNLKRANIQLVAKLDAIIELYESLDNGDAQEGLDVKIPKCDSFKEYIQYMKDIDFIFSQCPFISQTDEEIVFNTVDVGSMWLSFFIKAQAGKHLILSTIVKLSEVAIKIKSNYKVTKMQDEWLETMRQKNDVGQEVIDVFKQMKQKMLDDAVSELEGECGISLENDEDRDRARRSIDKMAMLIDKGVEIYSAIETPQEIKVMFPFSENAPLLPEGLQKLIEAKEENNGDETSEQ